MNQDCDVLVLGAGPAGSALAWHLANAGHDVVLADKKTFPRPKPCGEFLSPACGPYLAELGVADELAQGGMAIVSGMTLHGFGRRAPGSFRALQQDHGRHGFGLRREVLDLSLLQAARQQGVRWLPRHEFAALLCSDDGAVRGALLGTPDRGRMPVRARFVVGADGVRSPVARALGVQRPLPWLDRFALTTHYQGVLEQPRAEVHFVPGGYFAATTVDQGLFGLNLLVDRAALRDRTGADWDAFVAERLQHAPVLAARLAAATRVAPWRGIGPLAFTTRRQAGRGVALCGDACGYVDPLTGEGVYFALWGARALAATVTAALARPRGADALLRDYERQRAREIGPRLWLSKLLQHGLRHPFVVRSCLSLLAARADLADLVVTLTGDSVHPRDLLRPSFWRAFRGAAA
jgi:flavin-dependent dehydrogenase